MQTVNETPDFLSRLPKPLKRHISLYLNKNTLARLARCSKHWKQVIEERYIQNPSLSEPLSLLDVVPWPVIEYEGYFFNFKENSLTEYNNKSPDSHEIILLVTPQGLGYKVMNLKNNIVEGVIDNSLFPENYLTNITSSAMENQFSLHRFIIAEITRANHITYKAPPFFYQCIGHTRPINQIIRMSDRLVLTCSNDHSIKLWDSWTRECLHTFIGHRCAVTALLKVSDTQFISGGQDGSLILWDKRDVKTIFNTTKHTPTFFNKYPDKIAKLLLLPDNEFACAYSNGKLERWSIPEKKIRTTLPPDTAHALPLCLAIAPNGEILLVSAFSYTHWQFQTNTPNRISSGKEIHCATLLSTGILALGIENQIHLIDLISNNAMTFFTINLPDCTKKIIEYPNGCLLISTDFNMLIYQLDKHELINAFSIAWDFTGSENNLVMLSEAEIAHSISNRSTFEIIRFSSKKEGFFNQKKSFVPEVKNNYCVIS